MPGFRSAKTLCLLAQPGAKVSLFSHCLMTHSPLLGTALLALTLLAAGLCAEPVILHEKPSLFGPVIVVEDNGLRILQFARGGARQSVVKLGDPEHLDLPYAAVAFTGLALCGEPRRVLVVGLGGGTLPMFLRHYYPTAVIDAVDIDPEVVHVAKQFFGFREDERMRAHVADGRAFIEQTRHPYDLIFLDAYGSDSVPLHLTTEEFLRAVRRAVAPSGVVVGNIWDRHYNALYDAMVRTYQEVFSDLYILGVRGTGNRIFLALPRRLDLERAELARRARQVSETKRFRFDLGADVTEDFQRATLKNLAERVLRDVDQVKPK